MIYFVVDAFDSLDDGVEAFESEMELHEFLSGEPDPARYDVYKMSRLSGVRGDTFLREVDDE